MSWAKDDPGNSHVPRTLKSRWKEFKPFLIPDKARSVKMLIIFISFAVPAVFWATYLQVFSTTAALVGSLAGTVAMTFTSMVVSLHYWTDAWGRRLAKSLETPPPPPAPLSLAEAEARATALATIATVLKTVTETDAEALRLYSGLKESQNRLETGLGTENNHPSELYPTLYHSEEARRLLEAAHQELENAVREIGDFDTRTLDTTRQPRDADNRGTEEDPA